MSDVIPPIFTHIDSRMLECMPEKEADKLVLHTQIDLVRAAFAMVGYDAKYTREKKVTKDTNGDSYFVEELTVTLTALT